MTRLARFYISTEYLKERLHIPVNTDIMEMHVNDDNREIAVLVSNPDLPELLPGDMIPVVAPVMHVVLWDWNIKSDEKV